MGGDPIRQHVFYERNFGWIDVSALNTEGLGPLWLMASATCGDIIYGWGGRTVPIFNYILSIRVKSELCCMF
jgi:hypothetical protein